jgi:membrane protein YqaA with SNARE-associated domain
LPFLKSLSAKLAALLALYGGPGLFVISFLDSSFLAFPLVNDLLLMHLASRFPRKALIFALACAVGSVLGASVVYAIARAGGKLIWRRRSPVTESRVDRWIERNDFASILVASLLPPPVPFKVFPISAGVLQVNPLRFVGALLVGRSLRFVAAALIGVHYGARAENYLRHNMGWVSLTAVALIVSGTLVYRQIVRRNLKIAT